jgi:SAM-dependent methyltransferase
VAPQLPPRAFDVVLARHVLFALPDPEEVLGRWIGLLRPAGRLVLVEGFWSTGAGLHATDVRRMLERHGRSAEVVPLGDREPLWGRPVDDERYLVVSAA